MQVHEIDDNINKGLEDFCPHLYEDRNLVFVPKLGKQPKKKV